MPSTGENPRPPPGLRVDVAALRRRGVDRHEVDLPLPAAWLAGILADTDAQVRDPGHVKLDLHLGVSRAIAAGNGPVIVSGSLRAQFEVPCGRCLDPAEVAADTSLAVTFIRGGTASASTAATDSDDPHDDDGLGLSEDDLDTWTYDGTTVDLAGMLAESVKVAYPMRALCPRGEACRGLCSNCGASLNDQAPATRCSACGREVVGGPDAPADPQTPAEGPLAAALRKLQLPD